MTQEIKLILNVDTRAVFKKIQSTLEKYLASSVIYQLNALSEKITYQLVNESNYTFKEAQSIAKEIVRREHCQYLSTLYPQNGISTSFSYREITFYSEQVAIGKFRNCYHRWEPGLAAFRKHSFKVEKGILIEYYHHSSPVIYEEVNFKKRIEGTRENLKQALKEANGKNLTEIRLLSTFQGPGGDYQQVLETYFSTLLENENQKITLFIYGLNLVRFVPDEIQTYINTRSINELFETIFSSLDIASEFQTTVDSEIIIQRNQLSGKINNLYKRGKDESEIKTIFLDLLKNHQIIEEAQYKKYEICYQKFCSIPELYNKKEHTLIKNDFDAFLKLRELGEPKYNGQIQAVLVRLYVRLNHMVVTGCNDAKDRDGMVSIVIEANEIYYKLQGFYPDFSTDRDELKKIQQYVYENSTPVKVAEYVSWPELAKGLDNTDQFLSGFKHLPNEEGKMAGVFKTIHRVPGYSLPPDLSYIFTIETIIQPQLFNKQKPSISTHNNDVFIDFHPGLQSVKNHQNSDPGKKSLDHVPILATIPLPTEFQISPTKNSLTLFSVNILGEFSDDGAFNQERKKVGKEIPDYQRLQRGISKICTNLNPDFCIFQESTEKTKTYVCNNSQSPSCKDRKGDFAECNNVSFEHVQSISFTHQKGKVLQAINTILPGSIDKYKIKQKDNFYIQIWNIHAGYECSPVTIEDSIITLLKHAKTNQPKNEKILHVFIGDFNRNIAPTPLDKKRYTNIATALEHPFYQPDKEQGIAFPDGCFYAYLDGNEEHYIIFQAPIEHINLETGIVYNQHELNIDLKQMPLEQQKKVKQLKWVVCLDDAYHKIKLINNEATIFEYETFLRDTTGENITVRYAKNQLNENGLCFCVNKALQDKIRPYFSDIHFPAQIESLEVNGQQYHFVVIDNEYKLIERLEVFFSQEFPDFQETRQTVNIILSTLSSKLIAITSSYEETVNTNSFILNTFTRIQYRCNNSFSSGTDGYQRAKKLIEITKNKYLTIQTVIDLLIGDKNFIGYHTQRIIKESILEGLGFSESTIEDYAKQNKMIPEKALDSLFSVSKTSKGRNLLKEELKKYVPFNFHSSNKFGSHKGKSLAYHNSLYNTQLIQFNLRHAQVTPQNENSPINTASTTVATTATTNMTTISSTTTNQTSQLAYIKQ